MTADHETVFSLSYADATTASRVAASVRPELDDIEGDRTRASLARDGATLTLRVEATDLVALRAGVNTWLTLVGVADDVIES